MIFTQSLDIIGRAAQHCGVRRPASLTETSREAIELIFAYDKLRTAELRRAPWRFATRRATIRPVDANTLIFIPSTYASGTTYAAGDVVQDTNGIVWQSKFGSNTGNTPGTYVASRPQAQWWEQFFAPLFVPLWSSTETYNAGELVYKSGPAFYVSKTSANLNNDPASGGPWVPLTAGSSATPNFFLPAGISATWKSVAQNIYPLPHGFLRLGSQDPKNAGSPFLAVSGGLQASDFSLEGTYAVSSQTSSVIVRFIADVADVAAMEPLFCEGLGARVGYECVETLTQSNIKKQAIGQSYQRFIQDARTVNLIETGSEEPDEAIYELTKGPQGVTEGGVPQGQPVTNG